MKTRQLLFADWSFNTSMLFCNSLCPELAMSTNTMIGLSHMKIRVVMSLIQQTRNQSKSGAKSRCTQFEHRVQPCSERNKRTASDTGAKLWHCYGQEQNVWHLSMASPDHFQHINPIVKGSTWVRSSEENTGVLISPFGVCYLLAVLLRLTQTCKND